MKEADTNEKVKAENEAKSQMISDGTRTADSDGDIYDYKIFNETKKMEAQEVLDIMEKIIQRGRGLFYSTIFYTFCVVFSRASLVLQNQKWSYEEY